MFDFKFQSADLIPMPSLLQRTQDNAMQRVMGQLESEIKTALDASLPEGRTLDEVKRRCEWIIVAGRPEKTLCLDGKPILEVHPIEFGEVERRSDSYVQTITQKMRRL